MTTEISEMKFRRDRLVVGIRDEHLFQTLQLDRKIKLQKAIDQIL